MPWLTPTLREVRSLVRDNIRSYLPGADAMVPNSVLRVLSDNQGALCHEVLQYIDWLAEQLMADTAEVEWLDRHADIWLVNADGSVGRKVATVATGHVSFTGPTGAVIPKSTQLFYGGTLLAYETTEDITLSATDVPAIAPVQALDAGSDGNLEPGTALTISGGSELAALNIGHVVVVDLENGTDTENDDDLRVRVLERIRQPPMGGAIHDYVAWAKAVPGVTRAWAATEMGIGTVSVRFMMDELRAENDGFPLSIDIDTVDAYIDYRRPVSVKDTFVMAPIKQRIDFEIEKLVPDTTAVRAGIEVSLQAMLLEKTAPGQTIYAAWKSYAIMSAPNVISFNLVNSDDDVMPSIGHMAVLGDIIYTANADGG